MAVKMAALKISKLLTDWFGPILIQYIRPLVFLAKAQSTVGNQDAT